MSKAQRSEQTKQSILQSAASLFASTGFEKVTMREIAKHAGCSHTAIYVYFQDKETLLFQLSREPLHQLFDHLNALQQEETQPSDQKLKRMALSMTQFGLAHRNMYNVFFLSRSSRVDEKEPSLDIQRLRNQLFALLREAVANTVALSADHPQALAYTRAFYYGIQGMITTYLESEESEEDLHARLDKTFELTVDVLLAGIQQHARHT